ncbi:MAG TPA: hypothetical protein DDX89_03305 [Candidatus Omnitrophica bacterium]|nr:MAG: hypothetical protein A3I71_04495 [Omnitrophica WOR_2 bacterium RIFCSPLOWO2_02_FULL_63_16]HBH96808.1 hypothetical protein [Candidatus Omnitrophota bacterium]
MPPTISFFVPCLNEEGNVGCAIDRLVEAMRETPHTYEILVVDDASTDASVAEVLACQQRHRDVAIELIRNQTCQGLGPNYFATAQRARGEHYMLINGDAVEPADSIRAMLAHLGEAEAIVPYFGSRDARGVNRKLISWVFATLVRLCSGERLRYYNGPVLHKTANIRRHASTAWGFGYQAELLCRLLREGISTVEVHIANVDRTRGLSKAFRWRNILSVAGTLWRVFLTRFNRPRDILAAAQPLKEFGSFRFYWRTAIRPYPRQAKTILFLMMVGALLDVVVVVLTIPMLDVLTAPDRVQQSLLITITSRLLASVGLSPTTSVVTFTFLAAASLLFAVRSAFTLWTRYAIAAIAVRLRRTTKTALFERFLRARYEAMSTRSRGTVINDIAAPAEAVAGVLTQFGYLLTGVLNALLMVGFLVLLSWRITLVIGILAVGTVQGWRRFADRRSAAYGRLLYGLRGEQSKLQVDAIDGLRVVKAHGLEPQTVRRQDALLAGELQPELRLVIFQCGPALVNDLIAIVIVVGLGAVTFLVPSLGVRVAMLAAFLLAIRRVAPALSMINQASVNLNRFQRELEVIEEVLRMIPQERQGGRRVEQVGDIRLDRLSFAYASRPDKEILHEVSVAMPRGTVTAVVGPTGAGKSTIAHMVLGLYEPHAGSVRVNGLDLREADLAGWRRHLGYVSQDVFVFNASIRENIVLGDEAVPSAQIEWAARLAQLHDFIVSLPDGYDTVVGDRGLRLSGGQCQRLAIARAILRKPDVLIFDEATSALDNLTERAVYSAISTLHREAIVLVIAHRLSTVRDADQIVVLREGRVVEQGTHGTLMQHGTFYARLYTEDDRRGTKEAVEPVETEPDHARAS